MPQAIHALSDDAWRPLRTADGLTTDCEVAETGPSPNKGEAAFRLIVLRWRTPQGDLFRNAYHDHCLATNLVGETPDAVVWRYNGCVHIENHLKELKGGFGMEWLPSGDFVANAVPCAIGVMTYNLFLAQRRLIMPDAWQTKTIKTIRWCLVEIGGKLITHGRHLILTLATSLEKYRLYREIRRRTYALLSA